MHLYLTVARFVFNISHNFFVTLKKIELNIDLYYNIELIMNVTEKQKELILQFMQQHILIEVV